ncbi:MAG: hypothetical protein RLZZ450_6339 [Pseudomonadota bacterium]|jgi:hypothetical protein
MTFSMKSCPWREPALLLRVIAVAACCAGCGADDQGQDVRNSTGSAAGGDASVGDKPTEAGSQCPPLPCPEGSPWVQELCRCVAPGQ